MHYVNLLYDAAGEEMPFPEIEKEIVALQSSSDQSSSVSLSKILKPSSKLIFVFCNEDCL